MLIEAVLRKKIEPIVLQTADSAEANSVCVSESSFQNMLNYNKQKLQGGALWGKDCGTGNQKTRLPTQSQITDF